MIEIKKTKEPSKLLHYRKNTAASYEDMDSEVKKELLERLLMEQGHLCAYCMRKIPESDKYPGVTIEHWYPRNPEDGLNKGHDLDYRNMFAVCMGNRGCGSIKDTTCDAHRGNVRLKVNPLNPDTLKDIKYSHDGTISSANPEIYHDIDETLNLNCETVSLPQNRKEVLDRLKQNVKAECRNKDDISVYCRKLLKKINDIQDPKIPFIGVAIWWLERHNRNNRN